MIFNMSDRFVGQPGDSQADSACTHICVVLARDLAGLEGAKWPPSHVWPLVLAFGWDSSVFSPYDLSSASRLVQLPSLAKGSFPREPKQKMQSLLKLNPGSCIMSFPPYSTDQSKLYWSRFKRMEKQIPQPDGGQRESRSAAYLCLTEIGRVRDVKQLLQSLQGFWTLLLGASLKYTSNRELYDQFVF